MNDKSDKTIEDVEMVFSLGTTLGMVSEMHDDFMWIDLYSFSYNIEIWDIFYWILRAFYYQNQPKPRFRYNLPPILILHFSLLLLFLSMVSRYASHLWNFWRNFIDLRENITWQT